MPQVAYRNDKFSWWWIVRYNGPNTIMSGGEKRSDAICLSSIDAECAAKSIRSTHPDWDVIVLTREEEPDTTYAKRYTEQLEATIWTQFFASNSFCEGLYADDLPDVPTIRKALFDFAAQKNILMSYDKATKLAYEHIKNIIIKRSESSK